LRTRTVYVRNSRGCWNTSEPFVFEPPTGVVDIAAAGAALRLYPHPTRERLTIELAEAAGAVEIVISDMNGREALRLHDDASRGPWRRDIDVRALASGTYVIRATSGTRAWTGRFVRE
jgi:hypothetical protein